MTLEQKNMYKRETRLNIDTGTEENVRTRGGQSQYRHWNRRTCTNERRPDSIATLEQKNMYKLEEARLNIDTGTEEHVRTRGGQSQYRHWNRRTCTNERKPVSILTLEQTNMYEREEASLNTDTGTEEHV
ncbi:hypothetical protein EOD39_16322 [Acipenser ruthenus]|uniref:Uncharacterized protein n=1 Tax=Acipenser ruthenus TaxID=7906 RepID=A0A444V631_ACIRT|nr:hypothetical protein EOD39_16322 [Acipenser ruthenus]